MTFKKRQIIGTGIIIIAIAVIIVLTDYLKPFSAKNTQAYTPQDSLIKCCEEAKRILKESLNHQADYRELEEQKYFVQYGAPKEYIQISLKYSIKDASGALSTEKRCFSFDRNLTLTEQFQCD
ncbi:hypothetical protein [Runella sp.]|uniref:hypothetical protein n=1 Tax=Runella sp. TaxID=1960881 RepID=UPI003D0D0112